MFLYGHSFKTYCHEDKFWNLLPMPKAELLSSIQQKGSTNFRLLVFSAAVLTASNLFSVPIVQFSGGGGGKAAMTANKVDYFESEKPAQLRLQHVCVRLPIGLLDSLKASFCRSLDWARSLLTAS